MKTQRIRGGKRRSDGEQTQTQRLQFSQPQKLGKYSVVAATIQKMLDGGRGSLTALCVCVCVCLCVSVCVCWSACAREKEEDRHVVYLRAIRCVFALEVNLTGLAV